MKLKEIMAPVACAAMALTGCSSARQAAFSNLGKPAKVSVFSAGRLVYQGVSAGKIENEAHSNGYYFQDICGTQKNKLVEVTGDVVIDRDDLTCPSNEVKARIAAAHQGLGWTPPAQTPPAQTPPPQTPAP